MSATVAFYKGVTTVMDLLVESWTNSPYSHCEIILSDGLSYTSSPRDGGVRAKQIDFQADHWDFVYVPWADQVKIKTWFDARMGTSYDWWGVLSFVLPLPLGSKHKWFCSEACSEALGIPNSSQLTPGDLHAILTGAVVMPTAACPAV